MLSWRGCPTATSSAWRPVGDFPRARARRRGAAPGYTMSAEARSRGGPLAPPRRVIATVSVVALLGLNAWSDAPLLPDKADQIEAVPCWRAWWGGEDHVRRAGRGRRWIAGRPLSARCSGAKSARCTDRLGGAHVGHSPSRDRAPSSEPWPTRHPRHAPAPGGTPHAGIDSVPSGHRRVAVALSARARGRPSASSRPRATCLSARPYAPAQGPGDRCTGRAEQGRPSTARGGPSRLRRGARVGLVQPRRQVGGEVADQVQQDLDSPASDPAGASGALDACRRGLHRDEVQVSGPEICEQVRAERPFPSGRRRRSRAERGSPRRSAVAHEQRVTSNA